MLKKIAKFFFVLVILGAITSGTFFLFNKISPPSQAGSKVEEILIIPKNIKFSIDTNGVLKAESVQNFGGPPAFENQWQFKISNMTAEGKIVKKGDVLINFDAQGIFEQMQQAQNELDQSKKQEEKMKVQISLQEQEISSKLAELQHKYETLKLKQQTNTQIANSITVEKDRLAIQQAEQEVTAITEKLNWYKKSSEASYNVVLSQKARAENKVNKIQSGIAKLQTQADREGVVVYKTRWNGEKFQIGETVWPGQPIMEIPDLKTIIAQAYVPEVDLGKVKLDQPVSVTIDALPGQTYLGKVKSIGRLVHSKAWDVPNKVIDVEIALENIDVNTMRPAMSLKAKLETASIDSAIAVPLSSVYVSATGSLVKVKTPQGWQPREVKLGDSNLAEVVILEGLKSGERIAADFSKAK
ncbi:MAG: efflux RND transporter periplasmic adaptor subunit [Blastocatellia bacterium]|nr:efflux RND transporter periplasmic adaptor subunit [Blastocatellia bacterium]MBN8724022.1 efflux RND transporter periplasmic adaptor subunit [Acidobacteriota bacterium]